MLGGPRLLAGREDPLQLKGSFEGGLFLTGGAAAGPLIAFFVGSPVSKCKKRFKEFGLDYLTKLHGAVGGKHLAEDARGAVFQPGLQ